MNPLLFDRESLLKEARKYSTRKEFRAKSIKYYKGVCRRNLKEPGFLELAFSHMIVTRRQICWTEKLVVAEAKNYSGRHEFSKKSFVAYMFALKVDKVKPGFMNKVCSHMKTTAEIMSVQRTKWTQSSIMALSKQYTTLADFARENVGAYIAMNRINKQSPEFAEKATQHMITEPIYREKIAQNKFHKKLLKLLKNSVIIKEAKIPKRDNLPGRVDFYIKVNGLSLAIEYKHDDSRWSSKEIKTQVAKYNRAYRGRKNFCGTYVVSPNGKYGFSENDFLSVIAPLAKNKQLGFPLKLSRT